MHTNTSSVSFWKRRMVVDKQLATFDRAVQDMYDGAVIHVGGFSGPGECPSYLIAAIARSGVKNLTVVSNHGGYGEVEMAQTRALMSDLLTYPADYFSVGLLVERNQVAKGILSFPVSPRAKLVLPFERKLREGDIELELVGQGTLAERIRAARAGLPAFYTPVGADTVTAEGKETRVFEGRPCVLERALKADFAIIRAHKADRWGNLVYRGTGRTFNATMAGAATTTIAEVDEVVPLGDLDPEAVTTPAPYVQRIVCRPSRPVTDWAKPC